MELTTGAPLRAVRSWVLSLLAAIVATAAGAAFSPVAAQRECDCARLAVASVKDTTFTFGIETRTDVKRGRTGVVLDPRRRDALVATFTVARVERGVATAIVTGQTTDVATTHVAMLDQRKSSALRSGRFWGGLLLGLLIGGGFGAAL